MTPKAGDAVAVVARSVESKVEDEDAAGTAPTADGETDESPVSDADVTIGPEEPVDSGDSGAGESPGESEG